MSITTPLRPETPEELAARVRGLNSLVDQLADAAGVIGVKAASDLRAEFDYIAMRIEQGPARPAFRARHNHPDDAA